MNKKYQNIFQYFAHLLGRRLRAGSPSWELNNERPKGSSIPFSHGVAPCTTQTKQDKAMPISLLYHLPRDAWETTSKETNPAVFFLSFYNKSARCKFFFVRIVPLKRNVFCIRHHSSLHHTRRQTDATSPPSVERWTQRSAPHPTRKIITKLFRQKKNFRPHHPTPYHTTSANPSQTATTYPPLPHLPHIPFHLSLSIPTYPPSPPHLPHGFNPSPKPMCPPAAVVTKMTHGLRRAASSGNRAVWQMGSSSALMHRRGHRTSAR